MIDCKREGDELVAILGEIAASLEASIFANDWVEVGRLNCIFRGFAAALGNAELWQDVLPAGVVPRGVV